MKRCLICKRVLPEDTTSLICSRIRCKDILASQDSLEKRMNTYTEFFAVNPPTETNYLKYFLAADLEGAYQAFVNPPRQPPREGVSRRVWFHLNIGCAHLFSEWKDEFGRPFQGVMEDA